MPIPDFNNIKELKRFLIKQKRKKIKYTPAEINAAKDKVKKTK
jgi:hypothetical protein